MSSNGKATCKEVCSNCKCTVVEKPIAAPIKKEEVKKKDNCVATIVGVLSLPDNFCCPQQKQEVKEEKKADISSANQKMDCVEVYRDLGECLQKCLVQSSASSSQMKQKNGNGSECDIGTCGSNGSGKSSKSKNGNGR